MELRVVLCTCPPDLATGLAGALVDQGLAACVNILPGIRSVYRWQGKVCDDGESLLLIKTRADRVSELTEKILELHPYDVPEVLVLDVVEGEGNPDYLKWVLDESAN